MDGVNVFAAVMSAIAAIGVIWERVHWLRSRPRPDVRFGAVRPVSEHFEVFSKHRADFRASVKNWGTEPAFSVSVIGIGCIVHRDDVERRADLGVGEELIVSVEITDNDLVAQRLGVSIAPSGVENAYVLVTWTSPSARRDRSLAAWFAVDEVGRLAEVRERQLARGPIRRAVARYTISPLPSPGSIAFGYARATPPTVPRPPELRAVPLRLPRMRRLLQKLFRVVPEWPFEASAES